MRNDLFLLAVAMLRVMLITIGATAKLLTRTGEHLANAYIRWDDRLESVMNPPEAPPETCFECHGAAPPGFAICAKCAKVHLHR